MDSRVLVISDLHLGGEDGFQMCSAGGRALLANFLQWVGAQPRQGAGEIRLVIAGDIVDFLAERDATGGFSAFHDNPETALGKLNRILRRTKPIWDELREACAKGVELTLLLGNHDLELSFPTLRARLAEELGGARIQFIYDNEAFTAGGLLVEHGNRYDGFNQVDHDGLRRHRSQLSRGEMPEATFAIQPGSKMVAQVMNRIKEKYGFVDLLKPETAGVVPILAALDWRIWVQAGKVIEQAAEAQARGGVDADGVPIRREFIAAEHKAPGPAAPAPFPDQDVFTLADELVRAAQQQPEERIGFFDDLKLGLLLKAFRKRQAKDATSFEVATESNAYLVPARAAAARSFQTVVMGHTHLPKRVSLGAEAVYLNTGTWADLMCLPAAVYDKDDKAAEASLKSFLAQVKANDIAAYRRPIPTFADVQVSGKQARGDVFFYDGDGRTEKLSTEGLTKRLQGGR